jgi:hypothetical protein
MVYTLSSVHGVDRGHRDGEGGVTCEQEIGDHAHGPDIDGFSVSDCAGRYQNKARKLGEKSDILFLKISGAMY